MQTTIVGFERSLLDFRRSACFLNQRNITSSNRKLRPPALHSKHLKKRENPEHCESLKDPENSHSKEGEGGRYPKSPVMRTVM